MFEILLVPTDGSDSADAAVRYAEDLAARYGATVHVLSVVDARPPENAPHRDRVEVAYTGITEQTSAHLPESDISVRRSLRTDVPHSAILNYATHEENDLVVVGTH